MADFADFRSLRRKTENNVSLRPGLTLTMTITITMTITMTMTFG